MCGGAGGGRTRGCVLHGQGAFGAGARPHLPLRLVARSLCIGILVILEFLRLGEQLALLLEQRVPLLVCR